jgi:hypothetical protein
MAAKTGSPEKISDILLLRTLVATLGERMTPPWWRTQFLTEVGMRALTRVFPRTAASAALSSLLIAARMDHDKRIGIGGRYHLFRLPAGIENEISVLMSGDEFAEQTATIVAKGRDDLIHELATMARGRKETSAEGPIRLGSSAGIADAAGVEGMATHYGHSFLTSRRAFPYFDDGVSAA